MNEFENYMRYKNDPWAFLIECCYTKDGNDRATPVKTLPDKDYLRLYCYTWQRYPLVAVPKSRRMTISWVTIGLYVWDTMFNRARHNAFVSKKEEDADVLVKKAQFMVDNIPRDKIPEELIPKYRSKFNLLDFYEIESKIQGFPQGADQLRQFTLTGIFGDESAFWEQAQLFYAASLPTIDGGGRMTLVSSPAPGFFKKLVFDALDIPGVDVDTAEHVPDSKKPMQGVRFWLNKKNRFAVLELHYEADPTKRHPEYKQSIKDSMPYKEYMQEYELSWDIFAGQPVYPEFKRALHVLEQEPEPSIGLPMLIGFDFGLTPAAIIGQYECGVLRIHKEIIELNMGAKRFAPMVAEYIRMKYPQWSNLKKDWLCYIDPAGFNRNDTDESTCAQYIRESGFNPYPGAIAYEERKGSVVGLLQKLTPEGPAMQVYEKGCPILVKGFEGGYRWPEKAMDIEPTKLRPLKDGYSHPHDALQYVAGAVKSISNKPSRVIPLPQYATRGR